MAARACVLGVGALLAVVMLLGVARMGPLKCDEAGRSPRMPAHALTPVAGEPDMSPEGLLRAELLRALVAVDEAAAERAAWDRDALEAAARTRGLAVYHTRRRLLDPDHDTPTPLGGTMTITAAVVFCNEPALVNGANASEILWRRAAGAFFWTYPVLPGDAEGAMEFTAHVAAACNGLATCEYTVPYEVPVISCRGKAAIDYTCADAAGGVLAQRSVAVEHPRANATTAVLMCTGAPPPALEDPHVGHVQPVRYKKRSHAGEGTFRVWPVQFGIPAARWVGAVRFKTTDFAAMIPGAVSTYNLGFHNARIGEVVPEAVYFAMYQHAYYCVTRKKKGWDTLRHVEILASGCVPYFIDLPRLPASQMVHFPRALVWEAMNLPGVHFNRTKAGDFLNPSAFTIDHSVFNKTRYFELATAIHRHARRHLTAEAVAEYVLDALAAEGGARTVRRVLFIHHCYKEYLSDSLYLGLKGLEQRGDLDLVADIIPPPEHAAPIWKRHSSFGCENGRKFIVHARAEGLKREEFYKYETALGHSNAFNLPHASTAVDHTTLEARVREKEFDVVVYGSIDRTRFLFDTVKEVYDRSRVAILRGEDNPALGASFDEEMLLSEHGVVFTREIFDEADGRAVHREPATNAPGAHDVEGFSCCDSRAPRMGATEQLPNPRNPQRHAFDPADTTAAHWVRVGDEGEEVACSGFMRMGSPGRGAWAYNPERQAMDRPVRCATSAHGGSFDDAAPAEPKECHCMVDGPYERIGREGEDLLCHGHVRYGDARLRVARITYTKPTRFKCSTEQYGGPFPDPLPGRPKECFCMWFSDPKKLEGYVDLDTLPWKFVGLQNDNVECDAGYARLGDPQTDRWVMLKLDAHRAFQCNTDGYGGIFTGDAAPGVRKTCQCAAVPQAKAT